MKSSELGKEVIRKELSLIPKSPGVYRMLNHKGDILYVGKAKSLPNRLHTNLRPFCRARYLSDHQNSCD